MNEKEDKKDLTAEEAVQKEVEAEEAKAEAAEQSEQSEQPQEEVKAEAEAEVKTEAAEASEAEEMVAKAEVDKRVSGMQSAMAKQMDAMKKDYEAKIADFQVQIKAKDEELTKARADVTSLTQTLDNTTKELAAMTSAFKEKADALDALNASVNTPSEKTDDWKSLKGQQFFDWYRKTH